MRVSLLVRGNARVSCLCRLLIFFLFQLLAACLASATQFELYAYNPVAAPGAVVVSGHVRFTVLTERVIRIEQNSMGRFVDQGTLAFVNRLLPVPQFTNKQSGGMLTIATSYLKLSYVIGQPLSAASLNITVQGANVPTYHFGDADNGNLLGTIKSLDELGVTPLNCTLNAHIRVHDESLHCAWGLISRNGWTTVDDSDNYILDPVSNWWAGPNPNQVDTYFFGHGSDYLAALYDYSQIGGAVAMPPRAANGVYWSRWYNMNDGDVLDLVKDYENRGLPLDCYILDMDWHTKEGWGGYSFDKALFPMAAAVMAPLRARGVLTSGNLHDLDGMRPNEDQYVPFCKAVGVDPSSQQTIAFAVANMTYALALEDTVLKALEDQSFGDFWWIDWQQGGQQGGCPGGKANPTILLNKLRATDKIRRGQTQRGMVLARWGGLGNHRYQVGFSGDVQQVTWQNLAYQPYFSFTAANVLYGQWSHDIVGNSGQFELYTRWVQWGAMSSVMRSHDRGMASGGCAQDNPPSCGIIKVWDVPTPYFEANRAALQLRHRLLPYIYNAQRQMFESGVSLMRPMYYTFPNEPKAYLGDQNGNFPQYMLGDDLLISPIVSAGFQNDTLARQTVWIPPGTWIEWISGAVLSAPAGGMIYVRAYDLSEIPIFIRAGAVVPMLPLRLGETVGRASQQYSELEVMLAIPPGVTSGSTTLYEDDGISTDYATRGAFFKTAISFQRPTTSQIIITVAAPVGSGYQSFPAMRSYTFRYIGAPPSSVTVDGASVDWSYDGARLMVVIETGAVATNAALTVQINVADASLEGTLFGLGGIISRSNLAKQTLDTSWSTPGAQIVQPALLSRAAASAVSLGYLAATDAKGFGTTVLSLAGLYDEAVSEVLGLKPTNSFPSNALVQWWSEERQDNCLCGNNYCNGVQASSGYTFVRIEGYLPSPSTEGTIPLNDFWNNNYGDNYASTSSQTPSGYVTANFQDGAVFASPMAGTVALQTWWSAARKDWLTVASPAGVQYAQQNGYVLGNGTIGYAYTNSPPPVEESSTTAPTMAQWARAYALVEF
jgi:alpha-glucosidase (family GH31 glycosyl hydrolase)